MLIGYVRVSTEEQNEERQTQALKAIGAEKIYTEKKSGKNTTDRAELNKMLEFAREGDIIAAESISRIARNTKDLLNIVDNLQQNNIEFISLKENIDTRTPQGKFMLTVWAAMAELERENILQRQREGIEIAKAKGVYKGREKIQVDEKALKAAAARWRKGEITATAAMKELNIKPNTFYRRIKELNL